MTFTLNYTPRIEGINWIPAEEPLLPPSTVTATKGEYSDKVLVTWTASESADGYYVYRERLSVTELLNETPVTELYYEDTTALPNTHYTYMVKAMNSEEESGFSEADEGYRTVTQTLATATVLDKRHKRTMHIWRRHYNNKELRQKY
jgi:hypothetical protein